MLVGKIIQIGGWLSRLVCWSVSYTDRKAGYLGWYITSLECWSVS